MKKYLLLFATAVTLTACGGSGGDVQSGSAGNPDAFSAFVHKVVASSPDDSEPQVIDSVAVTSPDDTVPMPVI